MAKLMKMLQPLQSEYVDRRFDGTKEEYFEQLEKSATLYIGNLSFYTSEDQVYELFSKVGVVQRVIIGLDRNNKTPCGFCFVIYYRRQDALAAVKYLNGTKLDNRLLRVDVDYGFEEGRQFGRGRSGGQVRDEFRTDYDADRGGYGRVAAQQLAAQQLAMWQEVQAGAGMGSGMLAPDHAVYFGQEQRVPQDRQQQQQQGGHGGDEGDPGTAAANEGHQQQQQQQQEGREALVQNPRLRGRGEQQDDDDEIPWEGQSRRKKQKVGGDPGAAAAQQQQLLQQHQEMVQHAEEQQQAGQQQRAPDASEGHGEEAEQYEQEQQAAESDAADTQMS